MKLLSNSEQQVWKDCKRKWWLTMYRQLKRIRPDVSRPRDVGSIVHAVLDTYYGFGFSATAAWARHSELMDDMRDLFLEDASEEERKDIEWIAEMTRVMLEGYFEWLEETGADVGLRVVEPEAELRVPLIEGVDLVGKVDLRVYDEAAKTRRFLETKTVGNFSDIEKTADINEQMLQYHLLEYLDLLGRGDGSEAKRSTGGTFNMIRRTKRTRQAKPPFYKRVTVWHNDGVLRNYWTHVAAVAIEIIDATARLDDGESHQVVCYPSPSKDCSWKCDFFTVCAMIDDPGSHAEDKLAQAFKLHNPLQRYTLAAETDNETVV